MATSIAYIISQYPAPSHTFIRREVMELRKKGYNIATFSIRAPQASAKLAPDDQAEQKDTYYVLPASLKSIVSAHIWAIRRSPRNYLRTLKTACMHRPPGVSGITKAIFYFVEAMIVAKEINTLKLHHIHNHFANPAAIVGLLTAQFLNLTFSLTLHGTSEFEYPAGLLIKEKVARASFVPCVSYFTRAQASWFCEPQDWPKMFINRCGIDLARISTAESASNLDAHDAKRSGTVNILCVGRLSPEKGQLALLQCFKELLGSQPHVRLTLIGGGPERTRLEDYVANNNLGAHCEFKGQLPEEDVLQAMAEADFLVLTSFMEGLPVVLMEALASGLPVIAPRVAGIPELVIHNHNGLLFAPTDWREFTGLMALMATDNSLRQRLANHAQTEFPAEFNIENAVEQLAGKFAQI